MPPPSPDKLIAELSKRVASTADLMSALNVSQSWISRNVSRLIEDGRVLRMGSTKGARYGLRREVAGAGSQWPLRRINKQGEVIDLGVLHALAGSDYYMEPNARAIKQGFACAGVSSGLPYFLQDQRPGGFLGRAVPRRYPDLNLPQRTSDWSDDHYLRYFTQRGSDEIGDLILGETAFDEYVKGSQRRLVIAAAERQKRYPTLAQEVMEGGLPGSSAHGEHPKFAVVLREKSHSRPVLVKFSPPRTTALGRRWSDLLVAEHHAHVLLQEAGLPACQSDIHVIDDRTYLEVDRFDRHGIDGRIGVTSLLAIDTAQYGMLDNWVASATRMQKSRLIDAPTLEQIRFISTFGELIANTDRHFGNLAFFDAYEGRFELAPVYDMLPMLFAPEHDQIMAREFKLTDPASSTVATWPRARALAEQFWERLLKDKRIGQDFGKICRASLAALQARPRTGAFAGTHR